MVQVIRQKILVWSKSLGNQSNTLQPVSYWPEGLSGLGVLGASGLDGREPAQLTNLAFMEVLLAFMGSLPGLECLQSSCRHCISCFNAVASNRA